MKIQLRRPNILQTMLLKNVVKLFLISTLVFSFFLSLVDLFGNINMYMKNNLEFFTYIQPTFFYLPKAASFSLPLSLLFAVAFTLGNMYSNNELIAVFSSGFSLRRLVLPVILLGLGLSAFYFVFEDAVVIPSMRIKTELTGKLLNSSASRNAANVTIYSGKGRIIYNVASYNDLDKRLSGLIILKKQSTGLRRLDAESAQWNETLWVLSNVRIFDWDQTTSSLKETWADTLEDPELVESPLTFRRQVTKLEEMTIAQAGEFIQTQRAAGFPTLEAETDFWGRISFAFTPLIVAFLSSSVGGRFKKNILIFSLFLSLSIGVVYYVLQLIFRILATNGALPVLVGAWGAFILAGGLGILLFRRAKT